jgi:hypothetical protein
VPFKSLRVGTGSSKLLFEGSHSIIEECPEEANIFEHEE